MIKLTGVLKDPVQNIYLFVTIPEINSISLIGPPEAPLKPPATNSSGVVPVTFCIHGNTLLLVILMYTPVLYLQLMILEAM